VEFSPFGGVMLYDWQKRFLVLMSRWSMLQKLWGQTECACVCHHRYPVFRFVVFFGWILLCPEV
jgi:hypothetical protein